jgi:ATP-dependent Clp protease ATP-binding subunit ClpC
VEVKFVAFMYANFTDRSRRVMKLAEDESISLHSDHICSEHVLLGLIKEGNGLAGSVLKHLEISYESVRRELERLLMSADIAKPLLRPSRLKKLIDGAISEADALKHHYVGTEHLLLALMQDPKSTAGLLVLNLGHKPEDIRAEVLSILGHSDRR